MKKLIFISLIALTGCQADDLFTSYGEEVTVTRQLEAFDKITAGEKFDVVLVQDTSKAGMVEVTAGKNVIDGYTTEVRNGELFIANKNKFNWVRKLEIRQKVVVYFKTLNTLQINGSAKFTNIDTIRNTNIIEIKQGGLEDAVLNIKGDYIIANCSNTGGVILSGSCFLYSGTVDDISFVDNRGLSAKKCYLTSYSRDNSYVDGIEELGLRLFGVGNIYYSITPSQSFNVEDSGDGEVIKK